MNFYENFLKKTYRPRLPDFFLLSDFQSYKTFLFVFEGWCQLYQYFMSSFFVWKFYCEAFMCLQFGFVIFWRKEFGAKGAHKMLVKLRPGFWIYPHTTHQNGATTFRIRTLHSAWQLTKRDNQYIDTVETVMLAVVYAKSNKWALYAVWRYGECRYDECRCGECHYGECRYGEYRYAEGRYGECRYIECRGAIKIVYNIGSNWLNLPCQNTLAYFAPPVTKKKVL